MRTRWRGYEIIDLVKFGIVLGVVGSAVAGVGMALRQDIRTRHAFADAIQKNPNSSTVNAEFPDGFKITGSLEKGKLVDKHTRTSEGKPCLTSYLTVTSIFGRQSHMRLDSHEEGRHICIPLSVLKALNL